MPIDPSLVDLKPSLREYDRRWYGDRSPLPFAPLPPTGDEVYLSHIGDIEEEDFVYQSERDAELRAIKRIMAAEFRAQLPRDIRARKTLSGYINSRTTTKMKDAFDGGFLEWTAGTLGLEDDGAGMERLRERAQGALDFLERNGYPLDDLQKLQADWRLAQSAPVKLRELMDRRNRKKMRAQIQADAGFWSNVGAGMKAWYVSDATDDEKFLSALSVLAPAGAGLFGAGKLARVAGVATTGAAVEAGVVLGPALGRGRLERELAFAEGAVKDELDAITRDSWKEVALSAAFGGILSGGITGGIELWRAVSTPKPPRAPTAPARDLPPPEDDVISLRGAPVKVEGAVGGRVFRLAGKGDDEVAVDLAVENKAEVGKEEFDAVVVDAERQAAFRVDGKDGVVELNDAGQVARVFEFDRPAPAPDAPSLTPVAEAEARVRSFSNAVPTARAALVSAEGLSSEVVRGGKPLKLYRGVAGDDELGLGEEDFYFATTDREGAKHFGEMAAKGAKAKARVLDVSFALRNPRVIEIDGYPYKHPDYDGDYTLWVRGQARKAKAAGHDGLVIKDKQDPAGNEYVAFSRDQITPAGKAVELTPTAEGEKAAVIIGGRGYTNKGIDADSVAAADDAFRQVEGGGNDLPSPDELLAIQGGRLVFKADIDPAVVAQYAMSYGTQRTPNPLKTGGSQVRAIMNGEDPTVGDTMPMSERGVEVEAQTEGDTAVRSAATKAAVDSVARTAEPPAEVEFSGALGSWVADVDGIGKPALSKGARSLAAALEKAGVEVSDAPMDIGLLGFAFRKGGDTAAQADIFAKMRAAGAELNDAQMANQVDRVYDLVRAGKTPQEISDIINDVIVGKPKVAKDGTVSGKKADGTVGARKDVKVQKTADGKNAVRKQKRIDRSLNPLTVAVRTGEWADEKPSKAWVQREKEIPRKPMIRFIMESGGLALPAARAKFKRKKGERRGITELQIYQGMRGLPPGFWRVGGREDWDDMLERGFMSAEVEDVIRANFPEVVEGDGFNFNNIDGGSREVLRQILAAETGAGRGGYGMLGEADQRFLDMDPKDWEEGLSAFEAESKSRAFDEEAAALKEEYDRIGFTPRDKLAGVRGVLSRDALIEDFSTVTDWQVAKAEMVFEAEEQVRLDRARRDYAAKQDWAVRDETPRWWAGEGRWQDDPRLAGTRVEGVVYHGTAAQFDRFDASFQGTRAHPGQENSRHGFFFSDDEGNATKYGRVMAENAGLPSSAARTVGARIVLKNPLVLTGVGDDLPSDVGKWSVAIEQKITDAVLRAKAAGNDGVIIADRLVGDDFLPSGKRDYIVFSPDQIINAKTGVRAGGESPSPAALSREQRQESEWLAAERASMDEMRQGNEVAVTTAIFNDEGKAARVAGNMRDVTPSSITDEQTGITFKPLVVSEGAIGGRIEFDGKDIGAWTPGEGGAGFRALIAREGDVNFSQSVDANSLRELSDKIQTGIIQLEGKWRKANNLPVLTPPPRSRQDPTPVRTGNKDIPPLKNQDAQGRGILTGADGRPLTQATDADPLLGGGKDAAVWSDGLYDIIRSDMADGGFRAVERNGNRELGVFRTEIEAQQAIMRSRDPDAAREVTSVDAAVKCGTGYEVEDF